MFDLASLPRMIHARVWDADLSLLPSWQATGIGLVRGLWALVRDVRQGDLGLHAMSLVYTTILSIVPLLAVSFSVLKGFGVHQQLEAMLMETLLPLGARGAEIADRIIGFVENVKAGVLGSLGLALLMYTVVSLMQKIEHAFNFIWRVPEERPLSQRFTYYLSVILIGPVLVFTSLGLSASLMSTEIVAALTRIEPFGTVIQAASLLLPFAMVVAAFTFIYVFIPNTRVHLLSAFAGALVAGFLWHLAAWAFAAFVVTAANYTAIYSAFAALIVFMLWLYVAWLVLLIGASAAFYHQFPEHLSLGRGELRLSPRMMERLALAMLVEIARDFAAAGPKPATEDLAARLGIPSTVAGRVVHALERDGLIVATAGEYTGWLPGRPPHALLLADVLATVRAEGEAPPLAPEAAWVPPAVEELLDGLETGLRTALAKMTLADLVPTEAPPPQAAPRGAAAGPHACRERDPGEKSG